MSQRPPVLERAFQLVEFDACRTVARVRDELRSEGYSGDDIAALTPDVIARLTTLLEKRGTHGP